MLVIIHKYTASPAYVDEVRPTLARLEEMMRALPGFVAYYFVETDEGIATVTVTEDETGTGTSMEMAANQVEIKQLLSVPVYLPDRPLSAGQEARRTRR